MAIFRKRYKIETVTVEIMFGIPNGAIHLDLNDHEGSVQSFEIFLKTKSHCSENIAQILARICL